MSGAPTTPIKRQPTGRACDLSREFCDVDIGLGVGDNEATDTQRPLAAQTRLATVWSPLITTNIGRRRSVAGEEAVGVDEFDVASGAG